MNEYSRNNDKFAHAGPFSAAWVCAQYEQTRQRLPVASFPRTFTSANDLTQLKDEFDVFLLDAFGVLNVGDQAIASGPAAVKTLQSCAEVLVLTNGATQTPTEARQKYARWGYDFAASNIVSSRDVLFDALRDHPCDMLWGVAAPVHAHLDEFPVATRRLVDDAAIYDDVDGFVLLSTADWPSHRQALLIDALNRTPRSVLVGNPDIAAPREYGFSIEPGIHAKAIFEQCGVTPEFCGKPFNNAFAEVTKRLQHLGRAPIPPERIAMVGDSLHTDILGGAAAGYKTILVTGHGLFKGIDAQPFIDASDIVPDYCIPIP